MTSRASTRREFLRKSLVSAAGALTGWEMTPKAGAASVASSPPADAVALTSGPDRAENILRALHMIRREIAARIGNRRVIVKPNCVSVAAGKALAATHADALEAILEFLKSIGRTNVTLAESSAEGPTFTAYTNYGYFRLTRHYPVQLMDLNQEEFEIVTIWNGTGTRTVRLSRVLMDPRNFVISVPRTKSHDCVVATLALKNVAMAAPVIDVGYWYQKPAGNRADKSRMHGSGNQDLNDNLHLLAPYVAPELAVIDGFEGMEGDGPTGGTAVSHQVAIASLDWLAAERVAIELMDIPARYPNYPAYLNYCSQTGLGQFDLAQITVLGERVADHVITYRLHSNLSGQLGMRATPRT